MEFEQEVADELFSRGYQIFYRNLSISVNNAIIGEFDIICRDFVIEVKSGKDIHSGGLYFMQGHNMLPKGYKYYIYCAAIDSETIEMFNKDYSNNTFIYTNTLQTIYDNHVPYIEGVIDGQSNMCKILNLSMESLKKFNRLYINYEEYNKVYISLNYIRDTYSPVENIKWSEKLNFLLDSGILVFCEEFDPSIPIIKGFFNHNKMYTMNNLEAPKLELHYSLYFFKTSPETFDIYLDESNKGPHRNYFHLVKKQEHALLRCR
jgi:hypothetical protein